MFLAVLVVTAGWTALTAPMVLVTAAGAVGCVYLVRRHRPLRRGGAS